MKKNVIRRGGMRLTIAGVAKVFGVTTRTVRNWAIAGKLPSIRLPSGQRRFSAEELVAWMRDHGYDDERIREVAGCSTAKHASAD